MKRSPLNRKTPMKRSRIRQVAPKKRTAEEGGDETYLCWIRGLPCCVCGCEPTDDDPTHPHHATLLGRGKSQKAHDHETMPFCSEHHRSFHSLTGFFDGWTRDGLVIFQELQIQRCRELWREFVDPSRFGLGHQL